MGSPAIYLQVTIPSQILDQRSAQKALTLTTLTYKLPLIVIVAPWKSPATPYLQIMKGSRDLILEFWDLSISRNWLKLETRNLACTWTSRGTNEKMKNSVNGGHEGVTWPNFGMLGPAPYLGNRVPVKLDLSGVQYAQAFNFRRSVTPRH